MSWDSLEDAFKELDSKEYMHYARALGAYKRALISEGFNDKEATELVLTYSKFLYDITLEEFLSEKRIEEAKAWVDGDDPNDVDLDDDEG